MLTEIRFLSLGFSMIVSGEQLRHLGCAGQTSEILLISTVRPFVNASDSHIVQMPRPLAAPVTTNCTLKWAPGMWFIGTLNLKPTEPRSVCIIGVNLDSTRLFLHPFVASMISRRTQSLLHRSSRIRFPPTFLLLGRFGLDAHVFSSVNGCPVPGELFTRMRFMG
jgi:hypothetical protein